MRQPLPTRVSERPPIRRDQIVTIEDLEKFQQELLLKFRHLLSEFFRTFTSGKTWLKTEEVRKILGCSRGKLHTLRANGTLPFSKIGGSVLYSSEAIEKVLQDRMALRKPKF